MMNHINVTVEFTGISRILTGETEIAIPLQDGGRLEDIVKQLGQRFPALIGEVINDDGRSMIPTNLFSINGEQILHEDQLHYQPKNGERLIMLSLLAGG